MGVMFLFMIKLVGDLIKMGRGKFLGGWKKKGFWGGGGWLRRPGRVFKVFLIQQHKFFVIACNILRTGYREKLGINKRRSDKGIKNCALQC